MFKALQRFLLRLTHKDVDTLMKDFYITRNKLLQLVENNKEQRVYLEEEAERIAKEVSANEMETARANRIAHSLEELLV